MESFLKRSVFINNFEMPNIIYYMFDFRNRRGARERRLVLDAAIFLCTLLNNNIREIFSNKQ